MSNLGYNGRDLYIARNGTRLAAVTTKSATLNKEPVDVTTDDSNGFRELLPEAGTKTLDLSAEGVVSAENQDTLMNDWLSDSFVDYTLVFADGAEVQAGNGFFITAFEPSGESAGAVTFSISLQSSGAITYTAAS